MTTSTSILHTWTCKDAFRCRHRFDRCPLRPRFRGARSVRIDILQPKQVKDQRTAISLAAKAFMSFTLALTAIRPLPIVMTVMALHTALLAIWTLPSLHATMEVPAPSAFPCSGVTAPSSAVPSCYSVSLPPHLPLLLLSPRVPPCLGIGSLLETPRTSSFASFSQREMMNLVPRCSAAS